MNTSLHLATRHQVMTVQTTEQDPIHPPALAMERTPDPVWRRLKFSSEEGKDRGNCFSER